MESGKSDSNLAQPPTPAPPVHQTAYQPAPQSLPPPTAPSSMAQQHYHSSPPPQQSSQSSQFQFPHMTMPAAAMMPSNPPSLTQPRLHARTQLSGRTHAHAPNTRNRNTRTHLRAQTQPTHLSAHTRTRARMHARTHTFAHSHTTDPAEARDHRSRSSAYLPRPAFQRWCYDSTNFRSCRSASRERAQAHGPRVSIGRISLMRIVCGAVLHRCTTVVLQLRANQAANRCPRGSQR